MNVPVPSAEDVARVVAGLDGAQPRAGTTTILAIDGRSGAGKTTLAGAVAATLGAPVVTTEFMYPGWNGLEAGVDVLLTELLEPLAAGRPVLVPQWDYARGGWGTPLQVEPAPIMVVEGVGTGARRIAPYVSLLVWVQLDDETRRTRAFARDAEIYRPHWERWADQEDAMLRRERTIERADVVVTPQEAGRTRCT